MHVAPCTLTGPVAALGLAVPVVLAAAPAQAWGAIAYSMSTEDWGYSYDYGNQNSAGDRALQECRAQTGASDCEAKVFFNNACGAVAKGSSPLGAANKLRVFRNAAGDTRADAEANALYECRTAVEPPLQNCEILVWACD